MRDEVLSSVGAYSMDKGGHQMSHLEDVCFTDKILTLTWTQFSDQA